MKPYSRKILWALAGLLFPFQAAFAQDHQITYFRNHHAGAVTIGFDDGLVTQVQNAEPLLYARGLRATFFVVACDSTCSMDVPWDQWRQVAAHGHEIASHTVTHPDLTTVSATKLQYELSQSQQTINQNIPSQSCISLAYPGNANNASVQAMTGQYYVSGRGGWADPEGGDMNFYQDLDPNFEPPPSLTISLGNRKAINFYDVAGDNAPFADTLANMEGKLDFAVANHAWYDLYFHDVPDQPFYINYFASLLNAILAKDLWVAPYGEVALYMRERLASTVSVLSSDSSMIQLRVTNSLDPAVYKEPLTMRSVVPSTWLSVSVTQGSFTTVIGSTVEAGSAVVYYDALPNGGIIALTQSGPLSAVSMSPSAVQGGASSTGTVTLNARALAGGAAVSLASSATAVAQVPPSITVQEGDTTATFAATTNPVTSDTQVTITALYNSTIRTADLTVTATPPVASLSAVSLNPARAQGGTPSMGTVTLNAAAPAGGVAISLTSSNTAAAQVPASVMVAAGATTAVFAATTSPVNSDTPVSITAVYNGASRTAVLMVVAPPAELSGVGMSPATVQGGVSSAGTITLDAPAPGGGAVVSLSSSNPSAAHVPASLTVPAGATTAIFTASTGLVAADTQVIITAVYNGVSRTATLMVTAPVAALSGLSVSPATVQGGTSSTGTVILDALAPAGGAVVTLTSSNTAAAKVPASVVVPGGATTMTFIATTSPVASKTAVTITAFYNNVSRTASLSVAPAALSKLSVSPASVRGSVSSVGTVTLTSPAAAGGAAVSLASSSSMAAQVPASVTVLAGATAASFTLTTTPVASKTAVTITAVFNSINRTATLTVTPAALSKASLSPATVLGAAPSTGLVTLDAPAPAGGAVVSLSSSNAAAAQVPASVMLMPGDTTAAFTATTRPVASKVMVTITALYNGVSRAATLTVTAPTISTLILDPPTVQGGSQSQGTVTLNGSAPAGGMAVTLTSGSTGVAQVPASVTVGEGQTSKTFVITTDAVASTRTVTISAICGVTIRATLVVAR